MLLGVCLVELGVRGLDGHATAVGHGVASVDHQVEKDLFDLTGVGHDLAQLGGKDDGQLDARSGRCPAHVLPAEHAADDLLHAAHDLVQVEHAGHHDLAPAEREQLTRELRSTLAGLADLEHVLLQRIAGRQRLDGEIGVAEDDREHVVEVVGDPAGERPHGLEPLLLPDLCLGALQGLFGPALLGEVADRSQETGLAVPVVLDHAHLSETQAPGRGDLDGQGHAHCGGVAERMPDEPCRDLAEQLERRGVGVAHVAVGAHHHHGIGQGGEQRFDRILRAFRQAHHIGDRAPGGGGAAELAGGAALELGKGTGAAGSSYSGGGMLGRAFAPPQAEVAAEAEPKKAMAASRARARGRMPAAIA